VDGDDATPLAQEVDVSTSQSRTTSRRVARGAAILTLAVTAFPAVSARAATSHHVAYTVNFLANTVTPIDLATNRALPAIKVGRGPNAIAVTPDGSQAFVTNSAGNTVTPIDTGTNVAWQKIKVGRYPTAVAVTPDGSTAYVVSAGSGTVTPISTATDLAGPPIPVGSDPSALAITPDGAKVFVSNLGSNTVTPIDTATQQAGPAIPAGRAPSQIAITPNGRTAFVIDSYIHGKTIRPIRVATDRAGPPIKVGPYPHDIVITPDGKAAYVACFDVDVAPGSPGAGSVVAVDVRTHTVGNPISFGTAFPDYLVARHDSSAVYVTSEDGVTPIRVATGVARPVIPAGDHPWEIALSGDGSGAYVTDIGAPNQPTGAVTVLRLRTRATLATVPVGLRPVAIGLGG
jgi:YVTN family beta-propeller protein